MEKKEEKKMPPVKTQFGIAATADFEEMTYTFKMPEKFEVRAGEFAIVDKPIYDEMLEALKHIRERLGIWCADEDLDDDKLRQFSESEMPSLHDKANAIIHKIESLYLRDKQAL